MEPTDTTSLIDMLRRLKTLLTAMQLGEFLGLSPKTLFGWAKQGRIPVVRMGSAIRFDPRVIAVWLTERSVGLVANKRTI
jgi:predicted DNA-binding transcriptional regulator AlpA